MKEVRIEKVGTTALHDLLEEVINYSKEGYSLDPEYRTLYMAQRTGQWRYAVSMLKAEEGDTDPEDTSTEDPVITVSGALTEPASIESVTIPPEVTEKEVISNEPLTTGQLFQKLETLTKKVELLSFAEGLEIEIPEHVKVPKAISAYIKSELEKLS